MVQETCSKCGRSLLQLRQDLSIEQMRGQKPLCSVPGCPLVQEIRGFGDEQELSGDAVQGPSPPSVFVGRYGYPKVDVGPLLPPDPARDPASLDDPRAWSEQDILGVLQMRSNLVRSKATVDVRDARDATRSLETSRELAMAADPVDTEVELTKRSRFDPAKTEVDKRAAPMGPSVTAKRTRITENPSVPRRVDRAVSDTDAKARTVAWEMYDRGVADHTVQRLLSVGLLGQEQRRKLVPTRWSITATDDMLGRSLVEQVKDWGPVGSVEAYGFEHFGNRFFVVLFPRVWSFEMVEAIEMSSGSWRFIKDVEGYDGRSSYADDVTGAYYAARLAVLEHLRDRRRQAAPLVYREITQDYFAPLGVWVIREGVRRAMEHPLGTHATPDEAIEALSGTTRVDGWSERSKLLERVRTQSTLEMFLE